MKNFVFSDSFRPANSEAKQLREHVQIQSRHADVVEAHLMRLLDELGLKSETLQVFHEFEPLGEGVNLKHFPATDRPYTDAPPPAPQRADTDNEWWPSNRKPANYLVPNAGWLNHSVQGTTTLVYGISLFGVATEEMEKVVEQISAQQAIREDFVPLFITDSTDFHMFRKYGYVFEYFPSPEKQHVVVGSVSWQEYAQKRLDLLIRKWGIVNMINIGEKTILTQSLTPKEKPKARRRTENNSRSQKRARDKAA